MLPECQTAWIRMRRRVIRHLIRMQAVCIWDYSRYGKIMVNDHSYTILYACFQERCLSGMTRTGTAPLQKLIKPASSLGPGWWTNQKSKLCWVPPRISTPAGMLWDTQLCQLSLVVPKPLFPPNPTSPTEIYVPYIECLCAANNDILVYIYFVF